jgi:hypothetical protein
MTWRKADYPSNWRSELRPAVLKRADNRCERCGVPNHERGARDLEGHWHSERMINGMQSDFGTSLFGDTSFPKIIRIVLTVAHLPESSGTHDARLTMLVLCCQRCHFALDRAENMRKARATRDRKRGQLRLEGTL